MRKLSDLLFKRKPAQQESSSKQLTEDYYAHGYLGNMYLSLGDLEKAELEYSRAYTLFPSDEARTQLAIVRKRRAAQKLSTCKPASATRAA
jgi:tetratricopeptide (TPR) repeat protein